MVDICSIFTSQPCCLPRTGCSKDFFCRSCQLAPYDLCLQSSSHLLYAGKV